MLTSLDQRIKSAYPWYKFSLKSINCRKEIESVCSSLRKYLFEPDEEIQEVSTEESYHDELSASTKVEVWFFSIVRRVMSGQIEKGIISTIIKVIVIVGMIGGLGSLILSVLGVID